MGTPEFALPSLEILHHNRYPIPVVVTAPDKPRGRGQSVSPTPVKLLAESLGIPVLQPDSLKEPAFLQRLRAFQPDIIVVVAFPILPPEVFSIPRLASFNLHASLLPKYRGAAPINWAIMNGETETGVTTFLLKEKVDTGDILLQQQVAIEPEDDAGALHDKLAAIGAKTVLETLRLIEANRVSPIRQDATLATRAPKIFREHVRIDWTRPAISIHNQVRGLSPYPGAFTLHKGRPLKIFKTRITASLSEGVPGEIIAKPEELLVSTGDSLMSILEMQQEGRSRMKVAEFLRGYRITTGEHLE